MNHVLKIVVVLFLLCGGAVAQVVVNVDFSRDTSSANPGNNPSGVIFNGSGPSGSLGTVWNDVKVPLSASGDTVPPGLRFNSLVAADGATTNIGVELTNGFYRAFNDAQAAAANPAALQGERIFARNGESAALTIRGLAPSSSYDIYLIASGGFPTKYTIGGSVKTATGSNFDGDWTEGDEYVVFLTQTSSASGQIVVGIQDGLAPVNSFGVMSGLQIIGPDGPDSPSIESFSGPAGFVQLPDAVTLNWSITGAISSLEIQPGVGDVLPITSGGSGSIAVNPGVGVNTYTLTLNGTVTKQVEVIRLPSPNKLHLYLFIGQSNMAGYGRSLDPALDAPHPRVLQFGSRTGMETKWEGAQHPLVELGGGGNTIGMGLEFGKAMLAAESDPEVVVGIINHALGSTAIQWWQPGAPHTKANRPGTGDPYYLYDEAVARVQAAQQFGSLKGVLWHQGEYNSNNNSNPAPEPALYASRLNALVDNLREDLGVPWLPFVCGKMVPASWVNASGQTITFSGLPHRATVEAALMDISNQRSNTRCVDNDGLRGMDDEKIHFDAYSQRLLGQRYASEISSLSADPFLLYLGGYFSPAQLLDPEVSDHRSDIDKDGFPALVEFAFLTDPSASDAHHPNNPRLSTVTLPGGERYAAVTFTRRTDIAGLSYTVEVSSDLSNWQSNVTSPTVVTAQVSPATVNSDGTETVTIRSTNPLLSGTPREFFRVFIGL